MLAEGGIDGNPVISLPGVEVGNGHRPALVLQAVLRGELLIAAELAFPHGEDIQVGGNADTPLGPFYRYLAHIAGNGIHPGDKLDFLRLSLPAEGDGMAG